MKTTPTFTKFKENVRKARQYVNNYDKVRWVIAELAQEVCDMTHGGRKSSGVFSVANFAENIEMEAKTLYEWIRIKKYVVDKLPATIRDNIHLEKFSTIRDVFSMVKPDESPKMIYDKFKFVKAKDPQEVKVQKYGKHLKSMKFLMSRPLLIETVTEATLQAFINQLDEIKNLVLKELELRTKLNATQRKHKKLNLNAEISRRMEQTSV